MFELNPRHDIQAAMDYTPVFDRELRAEMSYAVINIGLAAEQVQCEDCRRWWDTISPCAICNATTFRI